ncbi:MAG: putative bicarbonate transporter, IctB family [Acidobacteria bacterium]|nr:putative bicarbonate transporter, IctB family [Acidobacteriota bacterium]
MNQTDDLPRSVTWAVYLYLAHLLLQAWVASSELTAFWCIFFAGFALYRRQLRLSFHILYFPLALYALVSTISALTAPSSKHAFGEGMLWFKILLFPAALILLREIPPLRELALRAHIAFALFIASFGLFQYFVLANRDLEHRITGPASHVMTFSGLLLPTSLVLLVVTLHRRKPWMFAATAVVTLALALTFTRGAWLGWIVAVFVLLLCTRPRWTFYAAVALLYVVTFAPIPLFGRMISSFNMKEESNFDRLRMWQGGVEIIRDYPLLGVGPSNIKQTYVLYRKYDAPRFRVPHLHNNLVQLWAERGIIALLAYFLLQFLFLRECVRAWRGPNRMYAEIGVVVCVALGFAGLFEFNFGDTEVFWMMLDLYALVIASVEPPLPDPLYGRARIWPMPSNEPVPALVAQP